MQQSIIVGGLYLHYKGVEYKVIALAKHSETLVDLVIYQSLTDLKSIWARPLENFNEKVIINKETINRFTLLS